MTYYVTKMTFYVAKFNFDVAKMTFCDQDHFTFYVAKLTFHLAKSICMYLILCDQDDILCIYDSFLSPK